jgi:cytochrome c oxidase subunit II
MKPYFGLIVAAWQKSRCVGIGETESLMTGLKSLCVAVALLLAPSAALAQAPTAAEPTKTAAAPVVSATQAPVTAPVGATAATDAKTVDAKAPAVAAPPRMKPTPGIGMPTQGAISLQPQVTKLGQRARWMHDALLMPIIVAISVFVLGLLLWVMARYRRSANPVASKTTHNTFIEVVWTLVPVLILVVIAIPSISLLAAQYKPAPADAVVVKAIGNQWYWAYEYPDHGGFEVVSNMLTKEQALAGGEPEQLAVDNRMVIPVKTPIKVITTSNDVIHSWAVPAFWQKMDAVPGRLNEINFTVEREGVYYGQCSELCGARHGFMPITVEVVSPVVFKQWIASKGGTMPGAKTAAVLTAPAASAAPIAKN